MSTLYNYQQVIDIAVAVVSAGLPIAVIFGIAERACNMFLQFVFGKERIKL